MIKRTVSVVTICLAVISAAALAGCEKEPAQPAKPAESAAPTPKPTAPAAPPKPEKAPPTTPPDHPSAASAAAENTGAAIDGSSLKLAGITLTLPQGWISEPVAAAPMAPVAVLRIPKSSPNGEDGTVRITYFPNMKGMDESNIERWVGQVTKADGQPATRADAKIKVEEVGAVRLTIVDLTGTVKLAMRDTPKPDARMIAAIVDHPKGPHFVIAAGDSKSMETWADQVLAFLKSAKVD